MYQSLRLIPITNFFYIIARIAIAVMLSLSVYFKFLAFYDFTNYLKFILPLNDVLIRVIALFIQASEFFLAFQLLFNLSSRRYLWYTLLVMTGYTVLLIVLLLNNSTKNCFCFGTFLELSPEMAIYKNVVVIGLIALLLRRTVHGESHTYYFDTAVFLVVFTCFIFLFSESKNYFTKYEPKSIDRLRVDHGRTVFIDIRSYDHYEKGHIPNAVHFYFNGKSLTDGEIAFLKDIIDRNKDKTIVVYCDSRLCSLSQNFAMRLMEYFSNISIFYLNGGYEAWLGI